jgi:hypothetical protein
MSKRHAFSTLGDGSLAEFADLIHKRGFLDTLVRRAPAFSNFAVGIRMQLPVSPDPLVPAPEIAPGLGPIGPTLKLGFKARQFQKFARRERELKASLPNFLTQNISTNCNGVIKARCHSKQLEFCDACNAG